MAKQKEIREFWEQQALKGDLSGTQDLILDKLEQKAIEAVIPNAKRILEIGCGDGRNAINLKNKYGFTIDACDYSDSMIKLAKENAIKQGVDIGFFVHDIRSIRSLNRHYDLIIGKRVLINLESTEEQLQAIRDIAHLLSHGGAYIMCESSMSGLQRINTARAAIGLSEILTPWHNTYIDETRINGDVSYEVGLTLASRIDFSSTYYFLSRIVNAKVASLNNEPPRYDSPINEIALNIPSFGDFGQTIIWIWSRN